MKKCVMPALVVAVAYFLLDWVLHGKLLMGMYQETASMWRPMAEAQSKMWVSYLGYLFFGFLFTCIFGKGIEAGKCKRQQGIRFGIAIGLLVWGALTLIQYPWFPAPDNLYWMWFIGGVVEYAILGLIAGFLHKGEVCCSTGTM